jgi:outer membrane protein assembly factor BamB
MGSDMGINGPAMGMSTSVLTVGANGTLYILSRDTTQSGQVTGSIVTTKLSALSATKGTTLWSVVFDESWMTKPVEGPDGRLFLVALGRSDMGQDGMSGTNLSQETDSKLYIVDPSTIVGPFTPKITTVTLAGEVASEPLIGGTSSDYTVYIVTFEMGYSSSYGNLVQGIRRDSTLYALTKDGTLKFKISLNQ